MMISEDIFVILHTDLSAPQNYDGYLTLELKDNANDKILLQIDHDYIKNILGEQAPSTFNPSSFDMITVSDGEFKILIIDSINGLYSINLTVDDEKKTVDLKNLILHDLT